MLFSSLIKKEIKQKSLHKQIADNKLYTEVLSGPAKGTIINVLYEKNNSGTRISIDIDLKISLKYRILLPLIKKLYKLILTGIFYKMNNTANMVHNN